MIPLADPAAGPLSRKLEAYHRATTVTRLAGLLTVPALQANTIRLEYLVHLAVAHCDGFRRAVKRDFVEWLNQDLSSIASLEDPVEDVFVTNVETPTGNCRLFEGCWESSAYFVQSVIDVLLSRTAPQPCRTLLHHSLALLRVSELVAARRNLGRWVSAPSLPQGQPSIPPTESIDELARAIVFTSDALQASGLSREALQPFIFGSEDQSALLSESTGHTSLERRPLVLLGDALVLALPHAISPAIRRYVLSELLRLGLLPAFESALSELHKGQIERKVLYELRDHIEPLGHPRVLVPPQPVCQSWLLRYDIDKYLHIILLRDALEDAERDGMSSFFELSDDSTGRLNAYCGSVVDECLKRSPNARGITCIVVGGVGRGFLLGLDRLPENWALSVMPVSNLVLLASDVGEPVKHFLKCMIQKSWVESRGVQITNFSGDFNLYCCWRQQHFNIAPPELPIRSGSMLFLETDFVSAERRRIRQLNDQHLVRSTSGITQVLRFGRDSYFRSLRERPIYASLAHIEDGILASAVETANGVTWLMVGRMERGDELLPIVYEFWSGFLPLFEQLVVEVERSSEVTSTAPREVRLDFSAVVLPDGINVRPLQVADDIVVSVDASGLAATVTLPPHFLGAFAQPDNVGERTTAYALVEALLRLHGLAPARATVETVVARVFGNSGVRILHVLQAESPVDALVSSAALKLRPLAVEDIAFARVGLSAAGLDGAGQTELVDVGSCNAFLHNVVDAVWGAIRSRLRAIDRRALIRSMVEVNEAVIDDRSRWQRTARAMLALSTDSDEVLELARQRELERSQIAMAARTVMEMAMCESPEVGAGPVSQWSIDELLAKVSLLIGVAGDSDAIRYGLDDPHIVIFENGDFGINSERREQIMRPFVEGYLREAFEEAAARYDELYEVRSHDRVDLGAAFPPEFGHAFEVEYGLSPDVVASAVAELINIALEQQRVVIDVDAEAIRHRFANQNLGDVANGCLRLFGLDRRPDWTVPPKGFSSKDIYPWRFGRRLSATFRPLAMFGDRDAETVTYGAGSLYHGVGQFFERLRRGQLPQGFFVSPDMVRFIGRVSNDRGHDFTAEVASALQALGWETRIERPMTEFGAPAEFGDVDVLAWKSPGRVLVVECKHLPLARTVCEVAEVCRRFRGEASDELARHMRRVAWITGHPALLSRLAGPSFNVTDIGAKLVTSVRVPIMYVTDLPMDVADIVPVNRLVRGTTFA